MAPETVGGWRETARSPGLGTSATAKRPASSLSTRWSSWLGSRKKASCGPGVARRVARRWCEPGRRPPRPRPPPRLPRGSLPLRLPRPALGHGLPLHHLARRPHEAAPGQARRRLPALHRDDPEHLLGLRLPHPRHRLRPGLALGLRANTTSRRRPAREVGAAKDFRRRSRSSVGRGERGGAV